MGKGDFNGAVVDYSTAIKLKPDYVDAFIGRGTAKYKKGDPTGALADYEQATHIKPELVPAPDLAKKSADNVTNEIARQTLAFLEKKDYNNLEDLAAKLRTSKERYADGVWMLANVYDGLIPSKLASDEDWDTRILDIGRWAVARPGSITARVAWANVMVAYAWKARGAGETNTVTKQGWQLFLNRLNEAARILKDAKALKERCPLYWRVMLTDALGLQSNKVQFNAIFDEATKFEPDCEGYYFRRAVYFQPQWYGGRGEWHTDLAKSADKIGSEKGDMLYAQVVWNIHQSYGKTPFWEDDQSWRRVDRGFEVIEKQLPDSLPAKIERARLAILANEAQAAVFYNSGIDKHEHGDLTGAIADYTKAIEIRHDYAKAYGNRGVAKFAKGDSDGAMADCNKAIEIDAKYGFAYFTRASLKQRKGELDSAMADLNKAIEANPESAQFYTARGNLKLNKGDQNGAKMDFELAAKSPKAPK